MLALALFAVYQLQQSWQQTIQLEDELVTINKGWSYYRLLGHLKQQGAIDTIFPYKVLVWLYPEYRQLRAGTFKINALNGQLNMINLLDQLLTAPEHQFKITFIEGTRLRDWFVLIAEHPELTHSSDNTQALNRQLNQQLDTSWLSDKEFDSLEGLFLPETYLFSRGSQDIQIFKQAFKAMQQVLQQHYYPNNPANLSPYQVLILASIIEKETALIDEMPLISSVFHNRLAKGMRLQTDPTVIYGLGDDYNGDITRAHLKQKTPYNTYQIKGLPPTPIAMPSERAIIAALNPATSDLFYFVANGDGGHTFSPTLAEHNKAVKVYLNRLKSTPATQSNQ